MESEELTTFDLNGEMKTHFYAVDSDTKPFNCNECEKSYVRKYELKVHIINEHTVGKKFFECKLCDENFKTKYSLDSHSIAKHPENLTKSIESEELTCNICNKVFLKNKEN